MLTTKRRARKELWTWRFGAALAGVTRVTWVIETHSAGGLYDEVRFLLDDPKVATGVSSVSYNRNGQLHILGLPNQMKIEPLDVVPDHGRAASIKSTIDWVMQKREAVLGCLKPSARPLSSSNGQSASRDEPRCC